MKTMTTKTIAPLSEQDKAISDLKDLLASIQKNKSVKKIFACGSITKKQLGKYGPGYKRPYSDIDLCIYVSCEIEPRKNKWLQNDLNICYTGKWDVFEVLDNKGNIVKILGKYPVYASVINDKRLESFKKGLEDNGTFQWSDFNKTFVELKDLR